MKLTACYMVKNEEKNLPRSLASIQGAYDELIIVDTGSTDGTREIARSFGARLLDFPWCDDFSAPRNAAIGEAQGDWILFLDADESFEYPNNLRSQLDALMEVDSLDAWLLPLKNVEEGSLDEVGESVQYLLRLFRNHPDLRYSGRIHENIVCKRRELLWDYAPVELMLLHTGYSSTISREKSERNLRLLLQEAKRSGSELQYACYLADAYYGLGDYEKASYYAKLSIEAGVVAVGDDSHLYHLVLECMRHLGQSIEEQLAWAKKAANTFPALPDHIADCGIILSSMGRLIEARALLIGALERYERKDYSLRQGSFFNDAVAARVAKRLEQIALLQNDEREAKTWHKKNEQYRMGRRGNVMRITACYIVRDEAKELAQSLRSLAGSADEIIVIHTGNASAVDATAASFSAALYHVPWKDDFASARNAALAYATGEWIIFLDADEYFAGNTGENLRHVLCREEERGTQLLLLPMHNIDPATGERLMAFYTPRVFRRREGRRYVGRVHEEIRDCVDGQLHLVEPIAKIRENELMLIHTGYAKALSVEKAERNLRILLKELSETEQPELLYMYLAEAYDGVGDAEHAIYYARRDLATGGHKGVAYASRSYRILLRFLMGEAARAEERLALAASAVRDYPDLPDFHAEYAECLADALDYEAAIAESERAAGLAAGYDGLEPSDIDAAALAVMARRRAVWHAILARAKEMRLAACLIVRDAGADFVRWAECAKAYADRLVVVDTGSVDGTRERAIEAGATVIDLPWQGDFAAARNAALSATQGADWVTVLDADEAFFDAGKVRVFAARTELGTPQIDAVQLPIVHVDEDDQGRELKRQPYIRLLRMGRGLFYEGRVHEQLKKAGEEPSLLTEGRHLPIRHTGYSTGRIRAKIRRNLALMEREIAEGGKKPHHDRYLADCYYGLGDYERALSHARAALAGPLRSIGAESDLYWLILGSMRELSVPRAEEIAFAREAVAAFPALPDFYGRLGVLLAPTAPREAFPYLQKAIALAAGGAEADGREASQFADGAAEVHAALAACQLARGDHEAAEQAARDALALDAHEAGALDVLCALRRDWDEARLASCLLSVVGEAEEGRGFLLRFAESYGHIALYRHLAGAAQADASLYERVERARTGQASLSSILEELAPYAGERIREAPAALLALERLETSGAAHLALRLAALLPPAMQAFWQAYRGADVPASIWAEGWTLFAPVFVRWGKDSQIERVFSLVGALDEGTRLAFFHALVAGRRWQAAISSAGLVPADSPAVDGAFWHALGRALFFAGERTAARECWERVLAIDPAHGGARAYLSWTAQDEEGKEVRA